MDERFHGLRELFDEQLATGDELGAVLAVTIEGEFVVDLWGGWSDPGHTRPLGEGHSRQRLLHHETVLALAALHLVDRGAMDLDAPVARASSTPNSGR